MTRPARIVILLVCVLSCSATAFAQSADKIISQYQKAMGGANQIRRIESVTYTGTVTNPATGQTGTFRLQLKRPDRMLLYMDLSGFEINAAFNGRSAWRRDSRDGLRTLTGDDGSQFKAEAVYRNDRFLNYKRDKVRAISLGPAKVDGNDTLVVELTDAKGIKRKAYFDAKNYLILRDEHQATGGTETITYSDYRKVDGVPEPFGIEIKQRDLTLKVTIEKVEHNQSIDDLAFSFPKISNEPLPAVPDLLRDVEKNQHHIDEILENYTYTEDITERSITNKGELVDKDSRTTEVSYYQGERLERVVKKNGKPLTKEEDDKETGKLEKRIREIDDQKRKEAEKKRKAEEKKAKGEQTNGNDDEVDVGLSVFLRMCDFVNPRRERFRGRDVIVFDFQPKPGIRAKSFGENFIQKLIGVMWVDEQAKEIARLEARLNDKFKIAGGLFATLQSGGGVVLEQEYVNNEVWLPSYSEVNWR